MRNTTVLNELELLVKVATSARCRLMVFSRLHGPQDPINGLMLVVELCREEWKWLLNDLLVLQVVEMRTILVWKVTA